jgi:hypothetical protein
MIQGKCNLLKPVNNLTGTFFSFSQYAQDLTEQYANPDSYRCLPSKYIAMELDYSVIDGEDISERGEELGNIFQNYFENACTFLRASSSEWNPEDSRTLLFQTLQKFGLMKVKNIDNNPISEEIKHIGDINIYSYNDNEDGIGYNEIYCYIPNEAKCVNYLLNESNPSNNTTTYDSLYICGYDNQNPFNGLSYNVIEKKIKEGEEKNYPLYIDSYNGEFSYAVGKFIQRAADDDEEPSQINTFVPNCLESTYPSDDVQRNYDKFNINTIVVLYDIVRKTSIGDQIIYRNIPLGIYFTGCLDNDAGIMSNTITKYVNSGQIYNQGTSYGLRICTRFLSSPNSTEIKDISVNGSAVSEIAPVLEKMGETLIAVEDSIAESSQIQTELKTHLSQFKNNKVNVPYTRRIGDKKYWFVNGKNTGAVAEYEIGNPENIINLIVKEIFTKVYSKSQIDGIISDFLTENAIKDLRSEMVTKDELLKALEDLRNESIIN